jgi:MoxR-like ATPase
VDEWLETIRETQAVDPAGPDKFQRELEQLRKASGEERFSHANLEAADNLREVLFGKEELIDTVIVGLLAGGHLLLEGLPGLGKTELVKGLAVALGLDAKRIQFTPDLLPGDITGNPVLEERDGGRIFVFQPGPVFTNLLLADEINRASPKTQSALLEAMQERRVTVLGETRTLPSPFFVLATQNPIELEGTYPLPEAQLDRFLFKISVGPNSVEVLERIIVERPIGEIPAVDRIMRDGEFAGIMALTARIHIPQSVANYIARLIDATQPGRSEASKFLRFGASPRATQALASACRARAVIDGRANAATEDVRQFAIPVLQHRILLDYSARIQGQAPADIISQLLDEVPVQTKVAPRTLQSLKV